MGEINKAYLLLKTKNLKMKEKNFAIITCWETAEVFITEYVEPESGNYEDFYKELNKKHDLNLTEHNSSIMITSEELNIRFI